METVLLSASTLSHRGDCQAGTVTRADGASRAWVGSLGRSKTEEEGLLEPHPNLLASVSPMPDTEKHRGASLSERRPGRGANLGSKKETSMLVSPTYPPRLPGAHLGLSQHDVLDNRWATGLAILQPHIGDLVAADLAMLLAGDGQLPGDVHGRGVQRLHLYFPWGPTRH